MRRMRKRKLYEDILETWDLMFLEERLVIEKILAMDNSDIGLSSSDHRES